MKKLIVALIITISLISGHAILIGVVNDGASKSQIRYYTDVLDREGFINKVISPDRLKDKREYPQYDALMWICGDSTETLSKTDKKIIEEYLKLSDKGVYVEGERVMYDSAFVDSGFFYKRLFDVSYDNSELKDFVIKTRWDNPITWGMKENLFISTNEDTDIMLYTGHDDREILFRVDMDPAYYRNIGVKTIGVMNDNYKSRVLLLSFSPPVRRIPEIDYSNFVRNLAQWLVFDIRRLIDHFAVHKVRVLDKRLAELLLYKLIYAVNAGSKKELDMFMQYRSDGQFPGSVYDYVADGLREYYKSSTKWQEDFGISTRIRLL